MGLLPEDPQKQKKLLIGVLPLFLLGAYWFFYHGKRQEEIAQFEARLEALTTKNETARIRAQSGGRELEQELKVFERHMARLEELVPSSNEVPRLLYDMGIRAQENGVEFDRMRPTSVQPGAFYTLETYEIGVFGSYHNIGRYLAAIGSLPRIVTPFNVSIEPRSGAVNNDKNLQASFRIKTYVIPASTEARTNASS